MKSPLLCLLLGVCAEVRALGTGEKFKLVTGGKAFDRFITIWLENQVCVSTPKLIALIARISACNCRADALRSFYRTTPK